MLLDLTAKILLKNLLYNNSIPNIIYILFYCKYIIKIVDNIHNFLQYKTFFELNFPCTICKFNAIIMHNI